MYTCDHVKLDHTLVPLAPRWKVTSSIAFRIPSFVAPTDTFCQVRSNRYRKKIIIPLRHEPVHLLRTHSILQTLEQMRPDDGTKFIAGGTNLIDLMRVRIKIASRKVAKIAKEMQMQRRQFAECSVFGEGCTA